MAKEHKMALGKKCTQKPQSKCLNLNQQAITPVRTVHMCVLMTVYNTTINSSDNLH